MVEFNILQEKLYKEIAKQIKKDGLTTPEILFVVTRIFCELNRQGSGKFYMTKKFISYLEEVENG